MDEPRREEEESLPPPVKLPGWVPVAIGVVLVALAALAAWTGLRDREVPFWKSAPVAVSDGYSSSSVPGEPEPGGSRVVHGPEGMPAPTATDASQRSSVVITGDRDSIESVVRVRARRGMTINVVPSSAIIYVNDKLIGEAAQFATADYAWEFGEPSGTYRVTIVAPGYRPLQFEVIADENAESGLARISGELQVE